MNVLRYKDVAEKVHYHPIHIRRLVKAGEFPQPIRLGGNRVAFVEQEIEDWLQEKADAR
jgi:prophage regulatory protein